MKCCEGLINFYKIKIYNGADMERRCREEEKLGETEIFSIFFPHCIALADRRQTQIYGRCGRYDISTFFQHGWHIQILMYSHEC